MTMKRILMAAALLASALPARGASTAEEAAAVWQPAGNLWLKLGEAGEYGRIKAHHYADTFAGKGKTLTLIGLAFSKERRTIVDAAIEELEM